MLPSRTVVRERDVRAFVVESRRQGARRACVDRNGASPGHTNTIVGLGAHQSRRGCRRADPAAARSSTTIVSRQRAYASMLRLQLITMRATCGSSRSRTCATSGDPASSSSGLSRPSKRVPAPPHRISPVMSVRVDHVVLSAASSFSAEFASGCRRGASSCRAPINCPAHRRVPELLQVFLDAGDRFVFGVRRRRTARSD